VTMISGLKAFDLNLKDAAKFFATRFACSCSEIKGESGKPDYVNIQGDKVYESKELLKT